MNRYYGLIVSAVGLVIVVLGVGKLVPNVTGSGGALVFLGLVLFGLSFIPKPEGGDAEAMPFWERLTKIFYAPGEVFEYLKKRPTWFAALLLIAVFNFAYSFAFYERIGAEKIVGFSIDKTKEISILDEKAKNQIEAGRKDAIEASTGIVSRVSSNISGFVGQFVISAVTATVFLLLILIMGGQINWWQAFSASVYGLLPSAVIQKFLSLILLYVKDPIDIHPILGQGTLAQDSLNFLVSSADNPALFSLLTGLSILWFYWVWLTATGLKITGERVGSTAAWTATLVVWGILLTFSVIMGFLFPSFLG